MLGIAFRKIRYAFLLLKVGGLNVFLHELRHQFYSTATYIGLEKNLDTSSVDVPCKLEYSFRLARAEDMKEAFQKIESEGKKLTSELIERKWFYDSGFYNCYIARSVDTDDLCCMQWLISTEDFNVVSHGFRNTLPKHKEGEVQFENGYTFEKYQGKGLFSSVHVKMFEVAKEKGFKRVIAYVRQDNIGSLKACERAGFRKFEKMSELKFLSLTKRKYGQELDLF